MGATVEVEERDDYIYARWRGEIGLADLSTSRIEMHRRRTPEAFLQDTREATMVMSPGELLSQIETRRSRGTSTADYYAILHGVQAKPHAEWSELMGGNRGWDTFRFFEDFDEAVAWLRELPAEDETTKEPSS